MIKTHDKIEKACIEAKQKFDDLGMIEYSDIRSKLEFVIGSYRFDRNPIGLYKIGTEALTILKKHHEANPKQIPKKLINDLEKALAQQHSLNYLI
jgi:hypothetical protein